MLKRLWIAFLTVTALLLTSMSLPAVAANTVLILGDSLSAGYGLAEGEGWVALLAKRLQQQAPQWVVVNASISGDTTSNGLQRLSGSLQQHKPAIVIIELGGNDGLRGTALPVIKQNLTTLVKQSQAIGAKVLLMEMRIPPNYGKKYTERFTAQYTEVSQETGAVLVPFFLATVGGRSELMQADGIHPNASGQPKMLDATWPLLKQVAKF